MAQLKILICGGGIAGNAVAFWCSKAGHDVTVIERFPGLRATGLQVDLRGHGIEVMRRMGLEETFRSKLVPEQGLQFVNKYGKVKAYFPANKTEKGLQSFTTDFEIMRGDFVKVLHDETKDRARYRFGVSIRSLHETADSITVAFSDGSSDQFDMVVGADGQGSATRKMMLGEGVPDQIKFLGQYSAYFTMPREKKEDEDYFATMYLGTGKRSYMIRRHNQHRVQVYMSCDSETLKTVPRGQVQKEKEVLQDNFQGAGWQTPEILKAMELADDFYLEHPGVIKLDTWSKGRLVLVGDAAYCPTANTGMGTTSSLVGAYILAGEIEEHCRDAGSGSQIEAAFKAYEQKFRPFMDQVQRAIEDEPQDRWMPTTPRGVALFNFLMGVAAFLRLDIMSLVLRENVKNWSLPQYEAMCGKI